jgi:NodT family efflux transporter outer membrane factor (OMF) lipoprotein
MVRRLTRSALGWKGVALSVALAGCAVGPDFKKPEAPKTATYAPGPKPDKTIAADGQVQRFVGGQRLDGDWWKLFACAKLNAIVDETIAHNSSLESAQATLKASQYTLRAGYGVFFPQVSVGASAGPQQYGAERIGQSAPTSQFSLFTLSTSVSYAVDIWGGQRRALEGLGAQVDAQRGTTLATYLTLLGNVANTVIAQAAYRAQIDAARASLALEGEQLRLTRAQAQGGTVAFSSVLSIQSQIASTEATIPPLDQKIGQAGTLLATLEGIDPSEWKDPLVTLADLTLPSDVPVSVPSELVRQRPDILIAEAELHASNAAIGVATAAMLPSLTLSATYGVNNTAPANLFSPNSVFWSVGPGIAAPIFDAGTLWFQRKATIETHRAMLANYRATVLAAFEQVADSLRALEHDAEALKAQREALDTAQDALRLIQINYQTGIANYLQVLIADGQYLQARTAYVQAVGQRLQDTVALYLALGGGWWNAPPKDLFEGNKHE